ncbi:ribosome small subunit-dependent GTPase A [bacterium]|jgi:ribosome biogenesis GTPase / thiamine phosphate phosphatase|nr:ribosome small subunit-dependent GTPase A [bacterium]MBT4250959.1 ribosome small subunit-dependent GTPase A [bacterium]MBT4597853.1 ribosome small subunit-dependent GTPase A [bacterium]MBT6753955.1 ribosome small subunit-dependent GTPase A [bacterium]MBT7037384.1 ribosome small subunit-dependent GTPase A [bacterium]
MKDEVITINELGWEKYSQDISEALNVDSNEIARITVENKSVYTLQGDQGELEGFLRGKVLYEDEVPANRPKVGDWVRIEKLPNERRAIIKEILPRKSKISRKGKMDSINEQILVTNIDTSFIIQGLDNDFNLRRLERYLSIVEEGGSKPIVVLNKVDLIDNVDEYISKIKEILPKITLLVISAENGTGIDNLSEYIPPLETVVFIGSSGAGKSTIINNLLNSEVQTTKSVRDDDSRGRHTTTRRELFILPNGGIVIDTPGMREVGISPTKSLNVSFDDIELLKTKCKFNKCDHQKTEGCAIKKAIEEGVLDKNRYRNFLKLENELERELRKKTLSFAKERKYKNKTLSKHIRKIKKYGDKYSTY